MDKSNHTISFESNMFKLKVSKLNPFGEKAKEELQAYKS
jgi:hypothetical protein